MFGRRIWKSFEIRLHIKTGLGIKNHVVDPNSGVENEILWLIFLGQFKQET